MFSSGPPIPEMMAPPEDESQNVVSTPPLPGPMTRRRFAIQSQHPRAIQQTHYPLPARRMGIGRPPSVLSTIPENPPRTQPYPRPTPRQTEPGPSAKLEAQPPDREKEPMRKVKLVPVKMADFWCVHCERLPRVPVTGACGHTRCRACVERHGDCPCGEEPPLLLATNVLVQRLLCLIGHIDGEDEGDLKENRRMSNDAGDSLALDEKVAPSVPSWKQRYALRYLNATTGRQEKNRSVRANPPINHEVARKWLSHHELDCILCCQTYRSPVTTPCGHTFCRPCIERCMDSNMACPLCNYSLRRFYVHNIRDTLLIVAAAEAAGCSTQIPPDTDDRLPMFVCTAAYPMVPCPLFVFEPRYKLMLRRCLRSGVRRFGMAAPESDGGYAEYGTVLEIRDCVMLEGGCSIVSTIGVSRFKILEKDVKDGYDVARVERVSDKLCCNLTTFNKCMYLRVQKLMYSWLRTKDAQAHAEIEATFGRWPDSLVWSDLDGPSFLWWVLAIIPLPMNIKVTILKCRSMLKRFGALELSLLRLQGLSHGPHCQLSVVVYGCSDNALPHSDNALPHPDNSSV